MVQNRFSLVLVATERAKQLMRGEEATIVNSEGNKEVVVALREIAAKRFDIDDSEVLAIDTYKPWDRRAAAPEEDEMDDELPPEL